MKVAILGIQNIKHMTLITLYTDYFRRKGIEYDVIYIDKYGIDEYTGASNNYKLCTSTNFYSTFLGKIIKGIRFIHFAKKILNDNKYDFVVVWREQTAAMFSNYLEKHYKNKYCVNIRDLWDEKKAFITKGVEKAVKHSSFNTVSSEGFIDYIPNADYLMVHSVNYELINQTHKCDKWVEGEPIVITYIGTVRFYDYCYSLIASLANDSRFILQFIGQGSDAIAKYADKNKICNVKCIGAFRPDETIGLLEGTHIINSAFGSIDNAEKRLMPIRYYYALYLNCPVLTTEGTWVDEEARRYGIGISIPDKLDNTSLVVADKIYKDYLKYLKSFSYDNLDAYREEIRCSYKNLEEKLDAIFLPLNGDF